MQQIAFRSAFVDNINQVRTNPESTGNKIYETMAPLYQEEQLHCFKKVIETFEGVEALNDLRGYLGRYKSVDRLIPSQALNSVAQRIADEKGANNRTDHDPPQLIYEKISGLANVNGNIGQLIAVKCQSAEQISTYFLIDDGLASRKRRRMLLDQRYRYIGVGSAAHRQYDTICVVLLAQDVTELRQSQYEPIQEMREEQDVIDVREERYEPEKRDMGHDVGNSYFVRVSEPNIPENKYRQI